MLELFIINVSVPFLNSHIACSLPSKPKVREIGDCRSAKYECIPSESSEQEMQCWIDPVNSDCDESCRRLSNSLFLFQDLALLVRLQRYMAGILEQFQKSPAADMSQSQKRHIVAPNVAKRTKEIDDATATGVGRQQVYFGALVVMSCTIKLSVAPARALTPVQAAFEGPDAAAIHKAVRKGDLSLGRNTYLGVVIGRKNKTALAVAQGVFKSLVVDALLRMNGANIVLTGAFLRNQIFYGPQLATYLGAHYLLSVRNNVPALIGSLAAFGNVTGLVRGIGDGVSDFVSEPVKGLRKSIQKLDPQYMVDGVARGTGSLARHATGGFADSAALLTSTFSKNLAILTLDRRYAQKRDRGINIRDQQGDFLLLDGLESGFVKLAQGFIEGVSGVVTAPIRGGQRRGFEGFAKGLGKGLLGLILKPMIGISDAATDVFVGVKSSVEGGEGNREVVSPCQIRPRRAMYGRDKVMRNYDLADATACALMLRTRIGGQNFLSHVDLDDRVAMLSDKRMLLLDSDATDLLLVKFTHISSVDVQEYNTKGSWSVLVKLNAPLENGSELEVIACKDKEQAIQLCEQIKHGMSLAEREE